MNAGLPHPFMLRRKIGKAERVIANGFMLGIIEEELFKPDEEHTLRLDTGDSLIVYTDGISEVQNDAGVPFDSVLKEQLLAHVDYSGLDLARKLVAATKQFSGRDHIWDDITVFNVEIK